MSKFTRSDIKKFIYTLNNSTLNQFVESSNQNILNEEVILGYNVEVVDGNLSINGITYRAIVAGISDNFEKNAGFTDKFVMLGIEGLAKISAAVDFISVKDGIISGNAAGKESKLEIQKGSTAYNDMKAGIDNNMDEFTVDGPKTKLKFIKV